MKKIISLWIFTTYFLAAQSPNFDPNIDISTLIDTSQVKIGEEINFKGTSFFFSDSKQRDTTYQKEKSHESHKKSHTKIRLASLRWRNNNNKRPTTAHI